MSQMLGQETQREERGGDRYACAEKALWVYVLRERKREGGGNSQ